MYEGIEHVIDGVDFCYSIYNKIKNVKNYCELKQTVKLIFIDNENSEYFTSKYIIIQALTKINAHLLWRLCYNLHPRLRSSPEEAANDILNPIESSQTILRNIVEELKNKK